MTLLLHDWRCMEYFQRTNFNGKIHSKGPTVYRITVKEIKLNQCGKFCNVSFLCIREKKTTKQQRNAWQQVTSPADNVSSALLKWSFHNYVCCCWGSSIIMKTLKALCGKLLLESLMKSWKINGKAIRLSLHDQPLNIHYWLFKWLLQFVDFIWHKHDIE